MKIAILLLTLALAGFCASWIAGSHFLKPARSIPRKPAGLDPENVSFASGSGVTLAGWWFQGKTNWPSIVLLHGIRANRGAMSEHARFLNAAGYSILSIDLQAHGESGGEKITFGLRESRDAQAAVQYARNRNKAPVGIIGSSLGGAAALLAGPKLGADCLVLEMVYPTLQQAVEDRIAMALGNWAKCFQAGLTWQLKWRAGTGLEAFRIIDHVADNPAPKLFIAGSEDRHTTLEESKALFAAAAEPKELWVIQGARHEHLLAFAGREYEERILSFFSRQMPPDNAAE